jgi:hypothetical protein
VTRAPLGITALAWIAAAAPLALAQPAAETFIATATLKTGAASASAPVTVSIARYASDAERDALIAAVRRGGSGGARTLLAPLGDAGFVQIGNRRTAIKFASQRSTGSGRLVTIVTAEPIVHLGAGLPESQSREGFDVAVAILDLSGAGGGTGELAPAAKVGVDESGGLRIQDYGATVVWLNGLERAR